MRKDLYTNGSVDLPKITKGRSFFDLSHSSHVDMNIGILYPIDQVIEIVPGDTFDYSHRLSLRMPNPPKTPTSDQLVLDIYWFYTPLRILWKNFDKFITGSGDQNYVAVNPVMPTIDLQNPNIASSNTILKDLRFSVLDYLGYGNFSVIGAGASAIFNPVLLPVRSYYYIWNEYFRYEHLQKEVLIDFDDTIDNYVNQAPLLSNIQVANFYLLANKTNNPGVYNHLMSKKYFGLCLMPTNRLPGYFSRALPEPIQGGDVKILEDINVVNPAITRSGTSPSPFGGTVVSDSSGYLETSNGPIGSLIGNLGSSESNTIRALSQAFALNKFLYIDNVYGQRITEWTYGHFGVNVPDSRVQRPEFLAKQRVYVNINQIMQSSASETNSPQGNAGAWSQTYHQAFDFAKSFVEFGYLISLGTIRVLNHSFSQGINKLWSYRTRFDFYLPEFNNCGDQEIMTRELYPAFSSGSTVDVVFGFQERYAHLKMIPSFVAGHMRPDSPNTLAIWTYTDSYAGVPSLSATWMMEPRVNVDRTLYLNQDTAPAFILDFVADIKAYRTMPYHSIPGGLTGSW